MVVGTKLLWVYAIIFFEASSLAFNSSLFWFSALGRDANKRISLVHLDLENNFIPTHKEITTQKWDILS